MGTIVQRKRNDGSVGYMAQVRVKQKGKVIHAETKTFDRKQAASAWVARRETELREPGALERIKAVPPGGGRLALPAELELACHARLGKGSATSIYGRIDPSKAAPTMTTRCTTPSCGRFIHPTEDRGLTLREAALLQTFPIDYVFKGNHGEIERQVGNAVPPKLAEALSLVVKDLVAEHIAETREQEEMHACESVATGAVSQHALH